MSDRLPSHLVVAMLRRVAEAEGDSAMIVRKGDADRGAILVQIVRRGEAISLHEQRFNGEDYRWGEHEAYRENRQKTAEYCQKRKSDDPDLWLIELDVADPPRFVALLEDMR